MNTTNQSSSRNLTRSIGMGVLLSMFFFYGIHVFGEWTIENYRPDPETTSTVQLHNICAIFGKSHTLTPNVDVSSLSEGVNGIKLGASFMNFFDGHIIGMIILAVVLSGLIFMIRSRINKNQRSDVNAKN